MNWFHKLKLRLRALFQKEKLDAEMEDEMRSHIEMQSRGNRSATKAERDGFSVTGEYVTVENPREAAGAGRAPRGTGGP